MNPMQKIRIEKLTLNIGTGKDQSKLEKAMKLLESIAGVPPVKTITSKRIPTWGLRPGLPIGCKITLRGKDAQALVGRLLKANDSVVKETQFDNDGNLAFGIQEYIDIPDSKYDPDIGMMGLQVCITFEKPGYRVKKRYINSRKIPAKHKIKKEEAIEFMKSNFSIKIGGSDDV